MMLFKEDFTNKTSKIENNMMLVKKDIDEVKSDIN